MCYINLRLVRGHHAFDKPACQGFVLSSNKNGIAFFLLLAGGFLCFSCASAAAGRETRPYVWLTDSARFFLLHPENIEAPMDNHQLLSASFDGQNFQMLAWVKADEAGLDMILMNELGANMGELSFRGMEVSFSSLVFPRSFGGEYIVADFQLCFYDPAVLRGALESIGLYFEQTDTGRRVFEGENLIIEIERSQNLVRLINHLRGYSLTLEGNFE